MISLKPELLATLARTAGLADPSIVVAAIGAGSFEVSCDSERPAYPASMIKVPIAIALADACARGLCSLDATARVTEAVLTTNDAPSAFVLGAELSLRAALAAMLSASDNVATNLLIDVVGRATVGAACAPYGATHTAVRRKLSGSLPLIADPEATGRNAHPAADAARLFAEIERRERQGDRLLWEPLAAQMWNDKLSRGWLPGDRFVHKTGDTDDASHDGGVLVTAAGRRFIIVVYSSLPTSSMADASHAAFARSLRPLLDEL